MHRGIPAPIPKLGLIDPPIETEVVSFAGKEAADFFR